MGYRYFDKNVPVPAVFGSGLVENTDIWVECGTLELHSCLDIAIM